MSGRRKTEEEAPQTRPDAAVNLGRIARNQLADERWNIRYLIRQNTDRQAALRAGGRGVASRARPAAQGNRGVGHRLGRSGRAREGARAMTTPTGGGPVDELRAARIIKLAPIGEDGLCTGCGTKPTRETGRCRCYSGPATVVAATPPPAGEAEGYADQSLEYWSKRALAAEARAGDGALDVERLRQAYLNVDKLWRTEGFTPANSFWPRVAAEYARLAAHPAGEGQ